METRTPTSLADSDEAGRQKPREYEASHRVVVIVIAVFVLGLLGTALAAILIPFDVAGEVNSMRAVQDRIVSHVREQQQWPRSWDELGISADDPDTAAWIEKVDVDFTITLPEVATMIRERGVDIIMAGELPEYDPWPGLRLVRYTKEMERFDSEARSMNRQFMRDLTIVMIAKNLINQATD